MEKSSLWATVCALLIRTKGSPWQEAHSCIIRSWWHCWARFQSSIVTLPWNRSLTQEPITRSLTEKLLQRDSVWFLYISSLSYIQFLLGTKVVHMYAAKWSVRFGVPVPEAVTASWPIWLHLSRSASVSQPVNENNKASLCSFHEIS